MAEQTITEEKIKYATGEYDVEVVRRLALPSARLNRISGIERCVRLVSLSLSQNRIARFRGALFQKSEALHPFDDALRENSKRELKESSRAAETARAQSEQQKGRSLSQLCRWRSRGSRL